MPKFDLDFALAWDVPLPILSADPAAGAEAVYISDDYYLVITASINFVTSATVGNRRTNLVQDDGGTEICRFGTNGNQVASVSCRTNWVKGGVFNANQITGSTQMIGIGDGIILIPGWRLRTLTDNLDGADNYGPLTILARRIQASA